MRWVIAGWLTLSTILNLIDRQTLSILAPVLTEKFHLSPQGYSNVVTAFLISYTVMYTVGGRFVDLIGERIGMAACILWWSVCTMLTACAQGARSLAIIRFLLGLGEPGNYPAALRATTRWFPRQERGLPIAMFSSGGAIGNVIAPPLVAALTWLIGWRSTFVFTGALGIVWLLVWLAIYRLPSEYPGITTEELKDLEEEGHTEPGAPLPSWLSLLKDRRVLALVLSRFVSDSAWYFYLFWTPTYLRQQRGFSLNEIGLYAWIPFVAGAIGGMTGGRASDILIARGVPAVKARTRILYICAAIAPVTMLTNYVHSSAMAIVLMAVMAFVAYSWFINTAALIPDLLPESVVGSVLGFIGTAGSGGAVLFSIFVGYVLSHYSYGVMFVIAGCVHLLGALILSLLLKQSEKSERGVAVQAVTENPCC